MVAVLWVYFSVTGVERSLPFTGPLVNNNLNEKMAIELTESKHDITTTSLLLIHKDLPQKCKIHFI